jgi:hypothetical protein
VTLITKASSETFGVFSVVGITPKHTKNLVFTAAPKKCPNTLTASTVKGGNFDELEWVPVTLNPDP